MYVKRAALEDSHDLEQGDILRNLPLPRPPQAKSLVLVRNGNKVKFPPAAEDLSEPDQIRAMCKVDFDSLAMVLSNSCDNEGGYPVLVTRVRSFKFSLDDDASHADKWEDISFAATGASSVKTFYLPDSPEFGFDRLEVVFPEVFPLDHSYLERCLKEAGTDRICGLSPEGVRHLQWALGAYLSRNARDDDSWPSDNDLRLKEAWLEREVSRGSARKEKYEQELRRIRERLGS
jgi:hypothetical protein